MGVVSQAFTTRAEAAAPPVHLVETMAQAFYEAGRPKGSSRPAWDGCEEAWRAACRREMAAAIVAAEAAGYRIVPA